MDKVVRVVAKDSPRDDLAFWLSRPAAERIEAVERLRRACAAAAGKPIPRPERVVSLRPLA